jgi:hypothetical protein
MGECLYFKPLSHGSVYFIGLAFGYIVLKMRPKKLSNVSLMRANTKILYSNYEIMIY